MLSFLREQELVGLPAENTSAASGKAAADNPEKTQEQEYLTISAQDKNARKSTLLLAVFFGLGVLCLLFMIKKSTPQTASAMDTEDTQIEVAITRLTGVRSEMFNGLERIVKKFYEFSNVQQVTINELTKNPFENEMSLGDLKSISDTEGMDPDKMNIIRQQQMMQQTKGIEVQSIMQLEQGNCCMIDDKLLFEGDSIKNFTVKQIGNNFVTLEADNMETTLKLLE